MTAQLIDGAALARQKIADLKQRVAALQAKGVTPGLATVLVGDDPASRVYIRNKARACAEAGVNSIHHDLLATASEQDVLDLIERLDNDPKVHGIIVQLPLPRHLDAQCVSQSVAYEKDVDGFSWHNLGALMENAPGIVPCTPRATMALLEHAKISIEGRHAVVVGRSVIVGKPAALLLINAGATVTVCNSRTPDLGAMTRQADILVVATGRANLITRDMVKPGAAVIDVGINRLHNGKLAGDVVFDEVKEVAGWITPVPGGVGPMTVAMLVENTVNAAARLVSQQ
ncbi:MAG: bifunctional methylenetetrahydrofolate dehydrogenase/methenyltetrahydrofolate cyclohydrolase FolD [Betaproteobacteria bacterium]|nr:bifunctional methylenetetrahydrofolate dehydrogenase/methenyltetrahydrofolate cyclohydrolase FolD [Betaproteobacteria bacterium]